MAVNVVDRLEIVDVAEGDRDRFSVAGIRAVPIDVARLAPEAFQHFVESAAIGKPGQVVDIGDALRLFEIAAQRDGLALAALHLFLGLLGLVADRPRQIGHAGEQLFRRLAGIDPLRLLRMIVHRLAIIGGGGARIAGGAAEGLDRILKAGGQPVDIGAVLFGAVGLAGERVEPLLGNRLAAGFHLRCQGREIGLLTRKDPMRANQIGRGDLEVVTEEERADIVHQLFPCTALARLLALGGGLGIDQLGYWRFFLGSARYLAGNRLALLAGRIRSDTFLPVPRRQEVMDRDRRFSADGAGMVHFAKVQSSLVRTCGAPGGAALVVPANDEDRLTTGFA